MTMREADMISLDEIRSVLDAYAGPGEPLARARRRRWGGLRPVLVTAVAVAALAATGAAIADGFGAFNGISTAQRAQTGANVLPAAVLARVQEMNSEAAAHSSSGLHIPQLLPDTARVLGKMPDGSLVYGLSDTNGELCTIGEAGGGCGPPLSRSQPITASFANPSPTAGGELTGSGVAIDGVTSVSFSVAGKTVTVPVTNNTWTYQEQDSHADGASCFVAHFADGSTVNPFPEVPCSS